MRYPQAVIIDPRKVLPSKHSFFIRGFPSTVKVSDVKDYFANQCDGKCKVDFFSYSEDKQHLFVAIRFESKSKARQLLIKHDGSEILGHKVEINWFKDIRKARKKVIENERKYSDLLLQPKYPSRFRPYHRPPPRWLVNRPFPPRSFERFKFRRHTRRRSSSNRSRGRSRSSSLSIARRSRSHSRHSEASSKSRRRDSRRRHRSPGRSHKSRQPSTSSSSVSTSSSRSPYSRHSPGTLEEINSISGQEVIRAAISDYSSSEESKNKKDDDSDHNTSSSSSSSEDEDEGQASRVCKRSRTRDSPDSSDANSKDANSTENRWYSKRHQMSMNTMEENEKESIEANKEKTMSDSLFIPLSEIFPPDEPPEKPLPYGPPLPPSSGEVSDSSDSSDTPDQVITLAAHAAVQTSLPPPVNYVEQTYSFHDEPKEVQKQDNFTQSSTDLLDSDDTTASIIKLSLLSDRRLDAIFYKKRIIEAAYRIDCESHTTAVLQLIRVNPDLKDRLTRSLYTLLEEKAKQSIKELRDFIQNQAPEINTTEQSSKIMKNS